jgi:hypothetical protein
MIKVGSTISVVAWGGETGQIVDETTHLWAIMTDGKVGSFSVGHQIVWAPKNKEGEWYTEAEDGAEE